MKFSRTLIPGFSLTAVLAVVVSTAGAQQGWTQAHTIKQNGKQATVSAVFYNGDEVWVVGEHGLIARSYDDARTFNEVDLGVDAALNDVFARGDRVWIVGDAGTILVSTDGGRSFVKSLHNSHSKGPAALDLYSIQFVDADNGYI
ncbi:MAG TPA: YCF48-related protein, partial [Blastocatellia bacterium]|nr:YCF48-related protein [Blastocatellia bacterium]